MSIPNICRLNCMCRCAHVNNFSFLDLSFACNTWDIQRLILKPHKTYALFPPTYKRVSVHTLLWKCSVQLPDKFLSRVCQFLKVFSFTLGDWEKSLQPGSSGKTRCRRLAAVSGCSFWQRALTATGLFPRGAKAGKSDYRKEKSGPAQHKSFLNPPLSAAMK